MHELANEGTGSCRRIFTKRMLKPTMQRASRISKGKKMIEAHTRVHEEKANQYASREDFHKIFSEDTNSLYQLSLLLTRDSAKAEQCFVSGLEDCVAGNSVFREWARSWAKRAIIQNAIRELKLRAANRIHHCPELSFPTSKNYRVVQADTSKCARYCALKISSGLCS